MPIVPSPSEGLGRVTSTRTIRGSQLVVLHRQVQNLHVHLSETGADEIESRYSDSLKEFKTDLAGKLKKFLTPYQFRENIEQQFLLYRRGLLERSIGFNLVILLIILPIQCKSGPLIQIILQVLYVFSLALAVIFDRSNSQSVTIEFANDGPDDLRKRSSQNRGSFNGMGASESSKFNPAAVTPVVDEIDSGNSLADPRLQSLITDPNINNSSKKVTNHWLLIWILTGFLIQSLAYDNRYIEIFDGSSSEDGGSSSGEGLTTKVAYGESGRVNTDPTYKYGYQKLYPLLSIVILQLISTIILRTTSTLYVCSMLMGSGMIFLFVSLCFDSPAMVDIICVTLFLFVLSVVCHVISQSWELMHRNNFLRYYHSQKTLRRIDSLVDDIRASKKKTSGPEQPQTTLQTALTDMQEMILPLLAKPKEEIDLEILANRMTKLLNKLQNINLSSVSKGQVMEFNKVLNIHEDTSNFLLNNFVNNNTWSTQKEGGDNKEGGAAGFGVAGFGVSGGGAQPQQPQASGGVPGIDVPGIGDNGQQMMKYPGPNLSIIGTTKDLPGLGDWNLDVLDLPSKTAGGSLDVRGSTVLRQVGVGLAREITPGGCFGENLEVFLDHVQKGYLPNPYHNHLHAADVANSYICMLKQATLYQILGTHEKAATVIASLCHDIGHPGYNNMYLQKSQHNLALLYNDRSILENYHTYLAFRLIQEHNLLYKDNLLYNIKDEADDSFQPIMSSTNYGRFRNLVVELILTTDTKFHFDHLAHFRVQLDNHQFVEGALGKTPDPNNQSSVESRDLCLKMIIKAADIGHSAKQFKIHRKWSIRVSEEFHRQGDREELGGYPKSPLCDRVGFNLVKSQIGFLSVVCLPLWTQLNNLCVHAEGSKFEEMALEEVKSNVRNWDDYEIQVNDQFIDDSHPPIDSSGILGAVNNLIRKF